MQSNRAEILAQGWPYVPTLLTQDPPMAMRYRRTVSGHFTRGHMRALRPHLEQIMSEARSLVTCALSSQPSQPSQPAR